MLDTTKLGPQRPYVVWRIDAGGQASGGQVLDAAGVRGRVAHAGGGLVLAVTVLAGSASDLADEYATLVGAAHAKQAGEPRPLTGPFVVPKSWDDVRLGAEGFVVGDLTSESDQRVPLVLGAWPVAFAELALFAGALEESKDEWPIRTPAHARTRLERLIKIDDIGGRSVARRIRDSVTKSALGQDLAYAGAIRRCEQVVDQYEDEFRAGHDFTREQHIRIEQLLQELVMRKGAFETGALETERLGLESRLVRLLNAQASRDASGTLQRVLAALTALVLVPTLIAGVFGANVPLPFEEESAMRAAMFALMACGGVLSYLLLSGIRQSSADRELTFAWPGDKPLRGPDRGRLARLLFVVLAAGAVDVAVEAWLAMQDADGAMESSTSGLTVLAAGGVVAVCSAVLVWREAAQRGRKAATLFAAGVLAAAATSALFRSDWPWGLGGLL